ASGVHRFNPRTFEVDFHFPIGPNPHGDVIDQWGYQFANDGTSGTGSYVNIGKGRGNKKWFQKRVRPVPATGILSSSHFPEEHEGNFLICNAIGFLGVLQHNVEYNGADITATEVDPIVVSSDPNFRPSDVEVGGDGALYILDWHNTLIGHMQHNMRDPNRDHDHGRIYRVTAEGRDLVKPAKMRGKPISEVVENFFALEDSTRYRARLELTGRTAEDITNQVGKFAASLDPKKADYGHDEAQALLECLWVFEEQRLVNIPLLKKVFQSNEPRVRAAAIRTLGHWAGRTGEWQETLAAAGADDSALVRAEAVKAAVNFEGDAAAQAFYEAAARPGDPEMNNVLNYARGLLNIDGRVAADIKATGPVAKSAYAYYLSKASVNDLLKLEKNEAVYEAILSRPNVPVAQLGPSLKGLAAIRKTDEVGLLFDLVENRDKADVNTAGLTNLVSSQPSPERAKVQDRLEALATGGKQESTRQLAIAGWVKATLSGDDAFLAASKSKDRLRDFLKAVPNVHPQARTALFEKVLPLIDELPSGLGSEGSSSIQQSGIHVDYYAPSSSNVAIETLNKMKPKASGIVPRVEMNVPQKKAVDKFALKFTGNILAPRSGKYTFYIASDDGSRVYLNDKQLINNDGLHGMVEKSASVTLPAGLHKLVVTYFDNGGGDGLRFQWQGPGIKRGNVPADNLAISGGETLHDMAIAALSSIPGRDTEKFTALAALVKAGKHRPAAIGALAKIKKEHWPKGEVRPLVDNLVGFLGELPAAYRTSPTAATTVGFARFLSTTLPQEVAAEVEARLQNLDVPVIAIGTVPHRMIYDKERIAVQAGKPVEFRFSNTDNMPHNFAIVMPGSLEEVGELAERSARDADFQARGYIPKSGKVLIGSKLLQTGENQAIAFEAPKTPGVYPYVCTYPGHYRRMYGALYVVANLAEYRADPVAYLAANRLPLKDELLKFNTRGKAWKFEELIGDVKELPMNRNFDVGKQLFKVANCVACHRLNNEGNVFGPDLAKLADKKATSEHILRSLIEPSKDIHDKFASYSFQLITGKTVTGMVIKEDANNVSIVIDPLAKGKPTIIPKDDIDARKKSNVSMMPKGLLDKLSKEEILDLIAYVFAKGDKKNKLFHLHKH
ncbi:MAG: hypothetical protein CMJ78_21560, partial [Planctomycetaceae bacterium]|nr:hypothetical protein [Planctomycetaceae bacterium]